MAYHIQTRARARVLLATSSIGFIIAAAMGSTWLGTHWAREASLHDQAQRMIDIADSDLDKTHFLNMSAFGSEKPKSEAVALSAAEDETIDAGAMAIAMRYDPSRSPQTQAHERSAIVLAQNLISLKHKADSGRKWGRMSAPAAQVPVMQASLTLGAFDKTAMEKPVLLKPKLTSAAPFAFKQSNKTDAECLTQAVYYEARGEGEAGMRAVAQVILNRVRHPAYPKTICGVVYQGAMQARQGGGCQFSFTCNGTMRNRLEAFAWKRAQTIASDALSGYVMKAVGTSTHFHTNYVNPVWASRMDRIATIGDHVFYQYRGGSARLQLASDKIRPSSPEDSRSANALQAPDGNAILTASANAATPEVLMTASDTTGANRADLVRTLDRAQTAPARAIPTEAVVTGTQARDINTALAQVRTAEKPVEKPPVQ